MSPCQLQMLQWQIELIKNIFNRAKQRLRVLAFQTDFIDQISLQLFQFETL